MSFSSVQTVWFREDLTAESYTVVKTVDNIWNGIKTLDFSFS
jgi:hypothetical protein